MAILLKRNSNIDPWFSVHGMRIKEGEIVKMVSLRNEQSSIDYPAEVNIRRSKNKDDKYQYIASLNCFDYIRG